MEVTNLSKNEFRGDSMDKEGREVRERNKLSPSLHLFHISKILDEFKFVIDVQKRSVNT